MKKLLTVWREWRLKQIEEQIAELDFVCEMNLQFHNHTAYARNSLERYRLKVKLNKLTSLKLNLT